MFPVGTRGKTAFLESATELLANAKYTELIGDQTRNYSITITIKTYSISLLDSSNHL